MSKHGRTLRERWDNCRSYTKETSTILRQLGFANIATCWFFNPFSPGIILPTTLLYAVILALTFFLFDILQYASGTFFYYQIAKNCQNDLKGTYLNEFCPTSTRWTNRWANNTITIFFSLKAISLIISYLLLIYFYVKTYLGMNYQIIELILT